MQSLGVSLEIIDRCQNHVLPGSKVRRHYLHHDYADEKREAWRLLGDRLPAYGAQPTEAMMKLFISHSSADRGSLCSLGKSGSATKGQRHTLHKRGRLQI
jgi:hypothetical protein